jgi:hypothetical protein
MALALLLVGQDLAVGEAGGIVDGDMQDLPADAVRRAGAIAVAHAVDAAGLLAVDVEQLAGRAALVADRRQPGLESAQAAEREPAQHGADGRGGPWAMPGPVQRCRRRRSITADLGRQPAGRELRSCRASSPPARYRASHL